MPRAASRDPIYYRRRYPAEVIELCVRWHLTYRLSYRDLVAMMAERDVAVSHTTIMRWVQRYVPEFERRWARFSVKAATKGRVTVTLKCDTIDRSSIVGPHRFDEAAAQDVLRLLSSPSSRMASEIESVTSARP